MITPKIFSPNFFSDHRSVIAATLAHFSVDVYSGMLPLILLILTDPLRMTYAQVGLVSMSFTLTSSLSQPLFGWLGDRYGHRWLTVAAVAMIATTVGVMRFVNEYVWLIVLALIAGLGSGAFHPQGATLAAHAPRELRGRAASIFMLGGNSGYALGPIFGARVFALAGAFLPGVFALIGIAQAALVGWIIPPQTREEPKLKTLVAKSVQPFVASIAVTLGLVIFLRAWIHSSVTTYIPQVYKSLGFSTDAAGQILFNILLPVAIGGLIGGTLSDKVGRRRILILSTALAGPALWGLLQTANETSFLLAPLLGLTLGASIPVTLVMAQSLIPRGMGMMSGVVFGFTFIAGGIGVAINGLIADQFGIVPTMTLNAALLIIAAALALFLPRD
ncbi:MAG: MFS transporter [Chloroflexi bacterium]|nr:MFS transporter [Chloroflexota bacterium]